MILKPIHLYPFILASVIFASACSKEEITTPEEETLKDETTQTDVTPTDANTLPITTFGNQTDCNPITNSEFDIEFIVLINQYRESIGLKKLTSNTIANYLAAKHTKHMICNKDFNHSNFGETSAILRKTVNSQGTAENIIQGYNSPKKMLDGWLSSPPHKKSIEEPSYTHTGFSTQKDANNRYWATQVFYK